MARYVRRPANALRRRGPWKHATIPVIGLVGGIGAGKSLVAVELAGRGALVLDADAIGHALLDQRPSRDEVLDRFGPEMLDSEGKIDRQALGSIIFAYPTTRRDLEAILHPRMRKTFEKAIDRAVRREEAKAIVLDAAILFEAGWNDLCDFVAFVDAPRGVRLARLSAQRGWDHEALEARENAQWSLDKKRDHADLVLKNEADPEALRSEVDRLWERVSHPPQKPSREPRRRPE